MTISSHVMISKLLLDCLSLRDDVTINRTGFLMGCATPDVYPLYRIRGHHFRKSSKHIRKTIDNILRSDKSGFVMSFKLGKISHYICDTFCLAHNHHQGKNPIWHSRYENALEEKLRSLVGWQYYRDIITKRAYQYTTAQKPMEYLISQVERYAQSWKSTDDNHSMLDDILFSVITAIRMTNDVLDHYIYAGILDTYSAVA